MSLLRMIFNMFFLMVPLNVRKPSLQQVSVLLILETTVSCDETDTKEAVKFDEFMTVLLSTPSFDGREASVSPKILLLTNVQQCGMVGMITEQASCQSKTYWPSLS